MKEIKDMLEKMREIIAEQLTVMVRQLVLTPHLKMIWEQIHWIYLNWLWLWKKNTDWRFRQRNCQMWKPSET